MTSKSAYPLEVPFTLIIEGREQHPYQFVGLRGSSRQGGRPLIVPTVRDYLKTGDYTLDGTMPDGCTLYRDVIAVERKTLDDLYTTLGSGRDRFEAEHKRLSQMAVAAVVIEAEWQTIMTCPPERSKLTPESIWGTFLGWFGQYGVPWFAVSNRRLAERATFTILSNFWEHHHATARFYRAG